MGTLGPCKEGLLPLDFPAVASHVLIDLLLCPLLRTCLSSMVSTHSCGQQPLRGLQEKEREVSGRGLGPNPSCPLPAHLGLFSWPPLLGCVLKRIFILQNVFKEPALGLYYHYLRAFIFQLVYFCFIEIVSFLCFRSAGRLGLFAFPGGAGGPPGSPHCCT